jgi:hypothetical protein
MRFKNLAGFATIVLAHAACGGDGSVSPSALETRESRRNVEALEGAAAGSVVMGSRDGTIELSADWTIAGNNFDLYLTAADCRDVPSVLSVMSCLVHAKAEGTSRPERLTFPGAAGASYQVFVLNRGVKADTVTVQLTVR